jgi:diaminohydroxyphosphoribosylaminopyrimidine deaminase / 5-amino-6-(5-phosphoribosylamino)uracil reductase
MSLESWLEESAVRLQPENRPLVTLCYAQSLDGSITLRRGAPLLISSTDSMRMTHRVRALHEAILVGVGTIESDDPQLTVRYADGDSPRPVILDSHLRIPVSAKVFNHPKQPIIACLEEVAYSAKAQELPISSTKILVVPDDGHGHIYLPSLLTILYNRGIKTLMVEGGAAIISSFLQQGLVDRAIITISPVLIGGLNAITNPLGDKAGSFPKLNQMDTERLGDDIIVWGEFQAE